jgi:hypothetical protein
LTTFFLPNTDESAIAALSWGFRDSITWGVDWNEVLRIGNTHFDQGLRAARLSDAVQRRAACELVDDAPEKICQQFLGPGGRRSMKISDPRRRTELMAAVLLDSFFAPSVSAHYHVASERELSLLCFALVAYFADHGRYPEKLADLVPEYLAAIPPDPLTDREYTYRAHGDGCLVYGWGQNLRDDDGRPPRKSAYDEPSDDVTAELGNSKSPASDFIPE